MRWHGNAQDNSVKHVFVCPENAGTYSKKVSKEIDQMILMPLRIFV